MSEVIERPTAPQFDVERAIAGLDHRSEDRVVRRVLEEVYVQALPPPEHDRQIERVRRLTRMNRGTFRRYLRHAQEAVQERTTRA